MSPANHHAPPPPSLSLSPSRVVGQTAKACAGGDHLADGRAVQSGIPRNRGQLTVEVVEVVEVADVVSPLSVAPGPGTT